MFRLFLACIVPEVTYMTAKCNIGYCLLQALPIPSPFLLSATSSPDFLPLSISLKSTLHKRHEVNATINCSVGTFKVTGVPYPRYIFYLNNHFICVQTMEFKCS